MIKINLPMTALILLAFFTAAFPENAVMAQTTHHEGFSASQESPDDLSQSVVNSTPGNTAGTPIYEALFKGTLKVKIINPGAPLNHPGLDYAPCATPDGKSLYFVSNRPESKKYKKATDDGLFTSKPIISHDFWVSGITAGATAIFSTPDNSTGILSDINTDESEGSCWISGNGRTLYFSSCEKPEGYGQCDIYTVSPEKGGEPENLGQNINTKYWDSQPSVTPDENRIYYASSRPEPPDSLYQMEIWFSDRDPGTGKFKIAEKLAAVNSNGRDWTPFICADGLTLIFSSDSLKPNYGGYDFYITKYDPGTKQWSKPRNLGEPLNTEHNEIFMSIPAGGDMIFFTSDREDIPGSQGGYDIFMALPMKE